MKKTLLTLAIVAVCFIGLNCVEAATVKVTKPTVSVNTTQEESVISKKLAETQKKIETAKKDAKAKDEANKKAAEAKNTATERA